MLSAVLIAAGLCARLYPDIPAGRWLHQVLVEEPMLLLARLERRHILFLLVGLIAVQAFAIAMPADMAVVMAGEVTVYTDVLLAVWSLAAATKMRAGWTLWRSHLPEWRPSRIARPRRTAGTVRRPRIRVALNDDEDAAEARRAA